VPTHHQIRQKIVPDPVVDGRVREERGASGLKRTGRKRGLGWNARFRVLPTFFWASNPSRGAAWKASKNAPVGGLLARKLNVW